MKNHLNQSVIFLVFSLFCIPVFAQNCQNTNFEDGNFNNWNGFTGMCCGASISTPGIVGGRHTIITTSTPDPNTNNQLMTMPPAGGGAYSVRLGNDDVNSQAESLKRTFIVDANTQLFTYQYAIVLQNPEGHPPIDQPKFEVRVYDQFGNIVNPEECGYYQVTAGPETDGWGHYDPMEVRYKDWSTVGIDLSSYFGTQVTVEFTVQDCGWGGHFGYAYLDASCGFLDLEVIGFCQGSSEATIVAPDGFDSYFWPHSGETTSSVVIPLPEEGDSIICQVTNQSGCATSILHIFEELPLPYAEAGVDTLICLGDEVDLWSDGGGVGGNYVWTVNGEIVSEEQSWTVSPEETTLYTVFVTNANGCFSNDSTATAFVQVNDSLFFELPADTTLCGGTGLQIDGPVATATYAWTASNSGWTANTASVNVNPSVTTTYYLTLSNTTCSYTDSMVVTVENVATLPDTIAVEYCPNSQGTAWVQLDGPWGYASYQWSTGTTSKDEYIDAMIVDTLELELVSIYGCPDKITYVLVSSPGPVVTASAGADTVCYGHTVTLSASGAGAGGTYVWTSIPAGYSGYGSIVFADPTQPTQYIVTGTSMGGCTQVLSNDTVTVYVDSVSFVDLGPTRDICEGDSVWLSAGDANGTFDWQVFGSTFSSADSVHVAPTSDRYYYLYVYGACSFSDYVMVDVHQASEQTITLPYCPGQTSLTLTAPPQYSDVFWPFFNNTQLSNVINNPTDGASYEVWCENQYGCTDTVTFVVDHAAPSVLSPINDTTLCPGDGGFAIASSNNPGDDYTWYTSDGTLQQTGSYFPFTPASTTSYYVVLTNPAGCIGNPDTVDFTVTVQTNQLINLPGPMTVCEGVEVSLSSPGTTGSYTWNYNGTTSTSNEIEFVPANSQTVTLTVASGSCSDQQSVDITIVDVDTYTVTTSPNPSCTGEPVVFAVSPMTYLDVTWFAGSTIVGTGAPMTINPTATQTYTAEVIDWNNCGASATVTHLVNSYPLINLGPDQVTCIGEQVPLLSAGPVYGVPYQWSTGDTSKTITVMDSGDYGLTIETNGCSASDTVNVYFRPLSYIGQVPNVFTPDHDDINEFFEFDSDGLLEYHIVIINRWGNPVFESNDPVAKWDGTWKGRPVDDGVYFYKIEFEHLCGNKPHDRVSGSVTVVTH